MTSLPFRPSIITSVVFPQVRNRKGATAQTIARLAGFGFFEGVEFAAVSDAGERREIRGILEKSGFQACYWVSSMQYESAFSISAISEEERRAAVAELLPHVAGAAECGLDAFAFLPGPDVAPALRPAAKESLFRSILEFAEEGRRHGVRRLVLETLDREVHKRALLGPTGEALEVIARVRSAGHEMCLCFDAAHLTLLGENLLDTMGKASSVVSQVHLSNCVTDPARPDYGDHHMHPGPPGFLDEEFAARLFRRAVETGVFGPHRPLVTLEAAGDGEAGSWELVDRARSLMSRAWEIARQ